MNRTTTRRVRLEQASVLALSLLAATSSATARQGGALPRYDQVPRTYTAQPKLWRALQDRAATQTVRLCILGDSQETSPPGHGRSYIPNINYQFWRVYGNCPETPLIYHFPTGGGGNSPAGWLWRGGSGANSGLPTRVGALRLPPSLAGRAMRDKPPQDLGWFYMLLHNGLNLADESIPHQFDYFNRTGEIRAEFVAATNPSSGEIHWRAIPTNSTQAVPWETPTGSGTITLGLEQPGAPVFKLGLTDPLDYGGKRYMVLEGYGSSPVKFTDFLGVRVRNLSHPEGLVVQTFSKSGLTLPLLMEQHAESWPCLVALGYDAFVIHLGANDAFSWARSARQYQADLRTLIDLLRDAHGDPRLPIAIAIEVHRADAPLDDQFQFDRQAGAAFEIARTDPWVLLLNLRRITEEDFGWGPENESYLQDVVHLTIEGQAMLARAFVGAMREAVGLPPPCLDLTGDRQVGVPDLLVVLEHWGEASATADVMPDGIVDVLDLLRLFDAWGSCF